MTQNSLSQLPSGSRDSVLQRGRAIDGWLGQLFVLYIVIGVLSLVAALFTIVMSASIGGDSGIGALGGGVMLLSLLPSIIGMVLYLFAIRAARGAMQAVTWFAGQGQQSSTLAADLQRFITWLTVGQWLTIVSVVLSVVLNVFTTRLVPQESGLPTSVTVIGGLIWGGLIAALNWLVYGAVKDFFQTVLNRASQSGVVVTPAATRAATWMNFVYIVQWIGAVIGGLGMLMAVLLPAMLSSSDEMRGAGAIVLVFLIPVLAFFAWLLSLVLRLVGHSRLFALDVGSVLDQGGAPAGLQRQADPWNP